MICRRGQLNLESFAPRSLALMVVRKDFVQKLANCLGTWLLPATGKWLA